MSTSFSRRGRRLCLSQTFAVSLSLRYRNSRLISSLIFLLSSHGLLSITLLLCRLLAHFLLLFIKGKYHGVLERVILTHISIVVNPITKWGKHVNGVALKYQILRVKLTDQSLSNIKHVLSSIFDRKCINYNLNWS